MKITKFESNSLPWTTNKIGQIIQVHSTVSYHLLGLTGELKNHLLMTLIFRLLTQTMSKEFNCASISYQWAGQCCITLHWGSIIHIKMIKLKHIDRVRIYSKQQTRSLIWISQESKSVTFKFRFSQISMATPFLTIVLELKDPATQKSLKNQLIVMNLVLN